MLCSYVNHIPFHSDAVSRALSSALQIYALLGSCPTDRNRFSSRHVKHIQLSYHPSSKALIGIKPAVLFTEGFLVGMGKLGSSNNSKSDRYACYGPPYIIPLFLASLGMIPNSELFKISSSQRESFLSAAAVTYSKDIDFIKEFLHMKNTILEAGCVSESNWTSFLSVIAALVHLQTVSIVGSESTIISSVTKPCVATAEALLGMPLGSISNMLLKKKVDTEKSLTSLAQSSSDAAPMVDCKPQESKALLDAFCSIVYTRCFEAMLLLCTYSAVPSSDEASGEARPQTLHLIDSCGWERMKVDDSDSCTISNNLHQCILHYSEELLQVHVFLKTAYFDEVRSYSAEGVDIGRELTCPKPDCVQNLSFFEKPTSGLFFLFEDACLSPAKVEEKNICEKIIVLNNSASNGRGRSALAALPSGEALSNVPQSSKSATKPTVFLVRHSFAEVLYDCESFALLNKTHTLLVNSNHVLGFVAASSNPLIGGAAFEASASPSPSPLLTTSVRKMEGKSAKVDKAALAAGLLFSKVKLSGSKLVEALQSIPSENHFFCCCLSPTPYTVSLMGLSFPFPSPPLSFPLLSLQRGDSNEGGRRDSITKNSLTYSAPAGAAGDVSSVKRDYVLQQLRHACLEQLLELSEKGYANKLSFLQFYSNFRPIFPHYAKDFLTVEEFIASSVQKRWKRSDFLLHCEVLYKKCLSALKHSIEFRSLQFLPSDFLVGSSCVFLRKGLADALESYRASYFTSSVAIVTKLQSILRKKVQCRRFQGLKRVAVRLQAFLRCGMCRASYLKLRQSVSLIQSLLRMYPRKKSFRRIHNAVCVIKSKFFAKVIAKIKYMGLKRATRLLQCVAKGFLVRRYALMVFASVRRLQRAARRFLRRRKLSQLQVESCGKIQRLFRGWMSRQSVPFIMRVLQLRRNQRMASKVVRKLQSMWRRFRFNFIFIFSF